MDSPCATASSSRAAGTSLFRASQAGAPRSTSTYPDTPVLRSLTGTAQPADNGSETILLVEDESFVRELAHRSLSSRGYRILSAVDGLDAVEIAKTFSGKIDLVLSDVVMPHMGVAELSAKLLQYRPGVRLLFMSGYSESAIRRNGVIDGARLIEKPFTPESLARQVRDVLDQPVAD